MTTAEVARELAVSKQTLLNWLYQGKVPEPPRDSRRYRLWSASRVKLVRELIADGRLRNRTVIHRSPSKAAEVVTAFAREVNQFARDAEIDPRSLVREAKRLNPRLWTKSEKKARRR
jgi:predicted site-specific integrase-resolvase